MTRWVIANSLLSVVKEREMCNYWVNKYAGMDNY